jgi:hypothetical protein
MNYSSPKTDFHNITTLSNSSQYFLVPVHSKGHKPSRCAFSHRLSIAVARVPGQVMWNFWWTKWYWGRFPPSTSVSLANSHSTDCSTLIIIHHSGLVKKKQGKAIPVTVRGGL